jgi:hypothetical protein
MTKGLHHFSLALLTDGYPSLSVGQVTLQRLLVFYISSHKCFILICNSKSISMHDTMCILHASCTKHVHLHHQDTCSQSLISALIRFFFCTFWFPLVRCGWPRSKSICALVSESPNGCKIFCAVCYNCLLGLLVQSD